jgi:2-oxoglutarate ferredoxin oxidoreductase subunit gamma
MQEESNMTHEMILAGFGGQGVMVMGQLLTYAGMLEGAHVSWIPSYGPEMRGGTANCSVIISQEPIGSPIVTEATAVVAMNLPSFEKFESSLSSGGILVLNSSLIDRQSKRDDIKTYNVPANEIANSLGDARMANMVALGALNAALSYIVDTSRIMEAFKKIFAKKPGIVAPNELAILAGAKHIIG